MSRQKKIKNVQEEKKIEVTMVHDKSAPELVDSLEEITEVQIDNSSFETRAFELEALEGEIDKARQELEKTKTELEEKKNALRIPLRDLDEVEKAVVKKQVALSSSKSALQKKIDKQKSYDNQQVTGRFSNRRAPGNPAKLAYMKYADDPVKWYTFEDGRVYTIPRGFADQINEHYYRPGFVQKSPSEALDPSKPGSAISEVDTSNKLYMFSPVNF